MEPKTQLQLIFTHFELNVNTMNFHCMLSLFLLTTSTWIFNVEAGLPLSTRSRWIVDEKGQRVKLACVNWVSHLEPSLAEGLNKQPVDRISNMVKQMGFNCVRLTWPLHLATNQSFASITVAQMFSQLGHSRYVSDIRAYNPYFVHLSLVDAFQAVVASLAKHDVMVVLDNHDSKPGWCCSYGDGEGFFGDTYFDPDKWIMGLKRMAGLFRNYSHVVAMSLRNELRGPNQNTSDWYRYMQRGAEAVHVANPNMLVIFSGLNFDTNLSFIHQKYVKLSFRSKLVFEAHSYAFFDTPTWRENNANQACGNVLDSMMTYLGFLLDLGFPLFISEFGIDLVSANDDDRRYINCFLAWAAENDLDWALWALQGSYYLRDGVVGGPESFGVLDSTWSKPKSTTFLQRLSLVQSPLQGPRLQDSQIHHIIFHPQTGLCVKINPIMHCSKEPIQALMLGPCMESEHWIYTSQKTITVKGTSTGFQAQGLHCLARINDVSSKTGMRWEPISASRLHLSARLGDGSRVCLDVDSYNNVITTCCKCIGNDSRCYPGNQWFKIVHVSG